MPFGYRESGASMMGGGYSMGGSYSMSAGYSSGGGMMMGGGGGYAARSSMTVSTGYGGGYAGGYTGGFSGWTAGYAVVAPVAVTVGIAVRPVVAGYFESSSFYAQRDRHRELWGARMDWMEDRMYEAWVAWQYEMRTARLSREQQRIRLMENLIARGYRRESDERQMDLMIDRMFGFTEEVGGDRYGRISDLRDDDPWDEDFAQRQTSSRRTLAAPRGNIGRVEELDDDDEDIEEVAREIRTSRRDTVRQGRSSSQQQLVSGLNESRNSRRQQMAIESAPYEQQDFASESRVSRRQQLAVEPPPYEQQDFAGESRVSRRKQRAVQELPPQQMISGYTEQTSAYMSTKKPKKDKHRLAPIPDEDHGGEFVATTATTTTTTTTTTQYGRGGYGRGEPVADLSQQMNQLQIEAPKEKKSKKDKSSKKDKGSKYEPSMVEAVPAYLPAPETIRGEKKKKKKHLG